MNFCRRLVEIQQYRTLQVLWTRAVLAKNGELPDDIAFKLLPRSTRDVVTNGLFDGASYFFEWVASRPPVRASKIAKICKIV